MWYSHTHTRRHYWRLLFSITCMEEKSTHTHEHNNKHTRTLVIHSYSTMNRASLLSLSFSLSPCSVWVTVQILPVIREQPLKQPPSHSIPAFQVRGNVRPNTHQGVLSLSPFLSLSLALSFVSEPVGREASLTLVERPSVCRSPTQHFKTYLSEPSPLKKKRGGGGVDNLPTVPAVHADNNVCMHLHTIACIAACACVADTNAHLRAALIIATRGIQHNDVHCSRQHGFTLLFMVSVIPDCRLNGTEEK